MGTIISEQTAYCHGWLMVMNMKSCV